MNHAEPASAQIEALAEIESTLRANVDAREHLNHAIFSTANMLKVHPHDLAMYILIRTASI